MGVPIVTRLGPISSSRVTAALHHLLGTEGWVAESPEAFVDLGVARAGEIDNLAALRASLRGRFDASPLGDHRFYVGELERAYRRIWQRWCADQEM